MEPCPWITVTFNNENFIKSCDNNNYSFAYPCETSSDCSPFSITLLSGLYSFQLFGGQGGGPLKETGKGGFIEGKIKLYEKSSFFVFIGAYGKTLIPLEFSYTCGGGGSGYSEGDTQLVGSGGGASDIRTKIDDLSTRIIVAGGGGGSGKQTIFSKQSNGGSGSGNEGEDGESETNDETSLGEGATKNLSGQKPVPGLFGFGANATQASSCDGSGGGGGYFGGAAGKSYAASGGGGSGFIDTALFYDIHYGTGVNLGAGLAYITLLKEINLKYCTAKCLNKIFPYILLYISILI